MDGAKASFRDFAGQSMSDGSFSDMLRLAEEGMLLGENEIVEKAMDKAREMNREDLKAALEDLDPCLPNPEVVKQDMVELMKRIQISELLGDVCPEAITLKEVGWRKIAQAVSVHFPDSSLSERIPEEYEDEEFSCCRDGEIEVKQLMFTDYATTNIPYTTSTYIDKTAVEGSGQLLEKEDVGTKEYTYDMEITIEGECVMKGTGNALDLTITIVGDVTMTGGGSGGWPLDDIHTFTIPFVDGAEERVIREGSDYRIFTLILPEE